MQYLQGRICGQTICKTILKFVTVNELSNQITSRCTTYSFQKLHSLVALRKVRLCVCNMMCHIQNDTSRRIRKEDAATHPMYVLIYASKIGFGKLIFKQGDCNMTVVQLRKNIFGINIIRPNQTRLISAIDRFDMEWPKRIFS